MRKAGLVLLAVALLAVGGWSAAWFYAAQQAGATMDAAIAQEHTHGRAWACPDRQIGGYPFSLRLSCTGASYAGAAGGTAVRATLAGLEAVVSLAEPDHVAITVTPPFAYQSSDGATRVTGTWRQLHLTLAPTRNIDAAELTGSGLALDGTFGAAGRQGGSAMTLVARFRATQAGADPRLNYAITVGDAKIPALDALIGDSADLNASLDGVVHGAAVGPVQTPEEALEIWRRQGGFVGIDQLLLRRAGASLTAQGRLGLDGAHRPQGRLDASFVGLDPILARYGIKANLAAVSSLVNALFGGGRRQQPTQPGAISLPISFTDGRLGIGPVQTGIALAPLY